MPVKEHAKKQPAKKGRPPNSIPNPFIVGDKGVERLFQSITTSKTSPVDINEVAIEFFRQVGGARGFVRMVRKDYKNAEPGSPERARLLSLMNDIWKYCADKDGVGNIESMSDDEIDDQIRFQFSRLGFGRPAEWGGFEGDGDGV